MNLPAEKTYFVFVYGVSGAQKAGAEVSLSYKPSPNCVLKAVGCLNAADPRQCVTYDQEEMAWQPMLHNASFPWFECRAPYLADLVHVTAETKPFCMLPHLYKDSAGGGGMSKCWPGKEAAVDDAGAAGLPGCAGVYDAADSCVSSLANVLRGRVRGEAVQDDITLTLR